ncbi:MAG TPA: gamma-glutamylcyclotransferase family protein [Vicinamibacterales bacterium]|nr:gamma-glutamylcyclotransferase family protein [Vicinamibacterales bacterium]
MPEHVFFYGTLRTGFNRTTSAGLDAFLKFSGNGWISAQLFDLGLYPAAVPATDARVFGEVFEMTDPSAVLVALDRIEGHLPAEPDRSLYTRVRVTATLEDGRTEEVWVYFYNAPLGRAPRISSGDYVEHLRAR